MQLGEHTTGTGRIVMVCPALASHLSGAFVAHNCFTGICLYEWLEEQATSAQTPRESQQIDSLAQETQNLTLCPDPNYDYQGESLARLQNCQMSLA